MTTADKAAIERMREAEACHRCRVGHEKCAPSECGSALSFSATCDDCALIIIEAASADPRQRGAV